MYLKKQHYSQPVTTELFIYAADLIATSLGATNEIFQVDEDVIEL